MATGDGRGGRMPAGVQVRAGRLPLWPLELALAGVLGAAYLLFALAVRGAHSFSGDEPHYLAFAQSLWLYHTIDQHNVLYHHDFFAYYDRLMSSHSVHRGGHLYPLHYLGLPLVLLPGFALAGAAGAQVTTALIGVVVCWRALRLAARVAGPIAASIAVGLLGLSAPFVLNAGAIYPDLLSGLLIILAFEALYAPRLTTWRAAALGVVLALCPWVHVKLLIAVALYLVWAAWSLARQAIEGETYTEAHALWRRAALALGLPIASLGALMAYNQIFYGSPSPTAPYREATLFTGNPLGGALGQLFAQGQGALGVAPLIFLTIPGAVALWRRDRRAALAIAYVTLPFWLVTLTYRDWWGGDAPPLRYLLPFLPLWASAIAALLAAARTALTRTAIGAVALLTLALSAAIPSAPRLGWPLADGQSALLAALGARLHLALTAWLPAFQPNRDGPGQWLRPELAAWWGAAMLALWALLAWWERRAHTRVNIRD